MLLVRHFYPLFKLFLFMALSLQQLFGPNASQVGDDITIKRTDFTSVGLNGTDPSASQVFAGLLKRAATTLNTDAIRNDPTNGVTASTFQQGKSFVSRGQDEDQELQIVYPITLNVYTTDTVNDFDPDNVKP